MKQKMKKQIKFENGKIKESHINNQNNPNKIENQTVKLLEITELICSFYL